MKSLLLLSTLLIPFTISAHNRYEPEPKNQINNLAQCTIAADILHHPSYHEYKRQTKQAIRNEYHWNPREILRQELNEAERKIERKAHRQHTTRKNIARDILHSPKCRRDYRFEVHGSIHIGDTQVEQTMVEPKITTEPKE